jgi:hypothetical protein
MGSAGETVADVVRRLVPAMFQLKYRTERGAWSEARGCDVTYHDFVYFADTRLMTECAQTADATCDGRGNINRTALRRLIKVELEILWGDIIQNLPTPPDADLAADSTAAARFREALVRLWTAPRTFERRSTEDGEVAARASLLSRARSQARELLGGGLLPPGRDRWRPVQEAFAAWWRPILDPVTKRVTLLLAMRWELAGQIGVELPGVTSQASLTTLGGRFGVLETSPPVTAALSGGRGRLAVLSLEFARDLLATPLDDPEEPVLSGDLPGPVTQ